MAYLDVESVRSMKWFADGFYNLTMAVGPDAANRRDDVMLVQYLLRSVGTWDQFYFCDSATDTRFDFYSPKGDLGLIEVDGVCGRQTELWIYDFQFQLRHQGCSILPDGRVDPARGMKGSISNTVYTIVWLNACAKIVLKDNFYDLEATGDCPAELTSALKKRRRARQLV